MVSTQDKATIQGIAKSYGVARVLLFGSSVSNGAARDIDLAVEGLAPSRFFSFYGDLIFALSKSVDVIDLDKKSQFTDIIRREGVALYG